MAQDGCAFPYETNQTLDFRDPRDDDLVFNNGQAAPYAEGYHQFVEPPAWNGLPEGPFGIVAKSAE